MVRKIIFTAVLVGVLLQAQRMPAGEVKLQVGPDGKALLMQEGILVWYMFPTIVGPQWKMSRECIKAPGYPREDEQKRDVLQFTLVPPARDGEVRVTGVIAFQGEKAEFRYVFEVVKAVKLNGIFVLVRFPVDPSAGKALKVGGQDIPLPAGEHKAGAHTLFKGMAQRVMCPLADLNVLLTTDPDTPCAVRDLREWGPNEFEVRLEVVPAKENQDLLAGAKYEKAVTVHVPGLTATEITPE